MMTLFHLDDDALFLHRCALAFRTSPHVAHIQYSSARSAEDFRTQFAQHKPSAVLLDLSFGGRVMHGLEILRELRAEGFTGNIIMMSALSSADVIMECMRAGANDFLSKGLDESEITFRVARLLQHSSVNHHFQDQNHTFLPTYASGRSLREVQQRLRRLCQSVVRTLLVTGESGTGKELVAETLRSMLPQGTPFVAVNCAALAPSVVEAEIFGYDKGSFTGATHAKIGLYEAADGGWLFLDEVARLSPSAQAALLRALENGEVRPIGSTRTKRVNVKVIAATNESLDTLVEKNEFRGDLLSRLRGYEITLPPLRARAVTERQEIIESLLARLNGSLAFETPEFRIASTCVAVLAELPWSQGNVRELWQTLQAMSVDATDGVITIEHLPKRYFQSQTGQPPDSTQRQQSNFTSQPQSTPNPFANPRLADILFPGFPCQFETIVDSLFEHVFEQIKSAVGEKNPSQRTVAQLLNITRHEASQRMSRLPNQAATSVPPASLKT